MPEHEQGFGGRCINCRVHWARLVQLGGSHLNIQGHRKPCSGFVNLGFLGSGFLGLGSSHHTPSERGKPSEIHYAAFSLQAPPITDSPILRVGLPKTAGSLHFPGRRSPAADRCEGVDGFRKPEMIRAVIPI